VDVATSRSDDGGDDEFDIEDFDEGSKSSSVFLTAVFLTAVTLFHEEEEVDVVDEDDDDGALWTLPFGWGSEDREEEDAVDALVRS